MCVQATHFKLSSGPESKPWSFIFYCYTHCRSK